MVQNFLIKQYKFLLFGLFTAFFASYGQTFFISLFNLEIRAHYNLSDGEFGFVYAVATILSSLLLIGFAKLIDYIDLRIYSLIMTIGIFLACLGMFLFFKHIVLTNNYIIF